MKTALTGFLVLLGSAAVSSLASAQEIKQQYFAINGYVVDGDAARGLSSEDISGAGADALFGFQLSGPWYAEARAFGTIFDAGPGQGSDPYNGGVAADLQYLVGQRGRLSAFVLGGVGFAYNDVPNNNGDEGVFQGNVGVGFLSRAITNSGLRLRFEARAIYEDFLEGVTDFRGGLGLEIPINQAEIVIREVPVPVGRAESDQVPPPRPGAYPPRPVDADNDGVLDNFDRCPDTLPGVVVDRGGCVAQAQTFTLKGVNFELDSARLTADSREMLEVAVAALKGQPPLYVIIAGHTDSTGSEAYNQDLSNRRAAAVRGYLLDRGVAAERLTTVGFGESEPVASNETELGRAQNRRVEFRLQEPAKATKAGAAPVVVRTPQVPPPQPAPEPVDNE